MSVYSEDLKILRPSVSAVITNRQLAQTKELDEFPETQGHIKKELDSIMKIDAATNKSGFYVDGFCLIVYSGSSREEAYIVKKELTKIYPELKPKVRYFQPNFRVKAGMFIDRLEANRIYTEVKESFPKTLLIPERFLMKYANTD